MPLPGSIVDAIVGTEQALDRLKLRYKARFHRFDPARIVAYRGFGRPDLLRLRGRVMEDSEVGFQPEAGLLSSIRNTIRRLETDEIRHARVRAIFRGVEVEVEADGEAFFEVEIEPEEPVEPGWHEVRLEVVESMAEEDTGPVTGRVFVPAATADFAVVSDLDDTVVRTGATARVGMFRTVLLNDARTRLPFQGVAPFYHALRAGPTGEKENPLFYLSRSAWNLYEMLVGFLDHRGLPEGPLLLKDYGLRSVLGGGGEEEHYKRDVIEGLLRFHPDLPFVLIGDSGQRDPEIYAALAREHPGRIRAIIIRDVTEPERDDEVRRLSEQLRETGVPMILAAESAAAAREAARLGLLAENRLPEIEADRESDEEAPGRLKRLLNGGR